MSGVDGFVAEHAVDGEVAGGARVLGETVQSPCRDSSGMCAEHETE